jgi:hypothetical protein
MKTIQSVLTVTDRMGRVQKTVTVDGDSISEVVDKRTTVWEALIKQFPDFYIFSRWVGAS